MTRTGHFDDRAQPQCHQSTMYLSQLLYFEAYDMVIYGIIADYFQKPDFLVHKNIEGIFGKLCIYIYIYIYILDSGVT